MEVTGVTGCAPCAPATLLALVEQDMCTEYVDASWSKKPAAFASNQGFSRRLNRFRVIDFGLADFCVRAQLCAIVVN